MPYTAYASEQRTRQTTGLTPYTWPPATVYVGVHVGAPGDSGANELSGLGYARQAVSWAWDNTNKRGQNSAAIRFFNLPAATITHFALWDSASGGNCLGWDALAASKIIGSGDSAEFAINQLTLKD